MRSVFVFCIVLLILSSPARAQRPAAGPTIDYTVSMDNPHTHYFDVAITVTGLKAPFIDFAMPVWTPGSYLVREFARNVQEFRAADAAGAVLSSEKRDKATWRVTTKSASPVTVRYRVYAFEVSVRTSFLDDMHGYINGASVFMSVDGHAHRPLTLTIKPYKGWTTVSTGLDPVPDRPFTFQAPNFDILVDCPIEIGTHAVLEFTARNVPHRITLYGLGNYDPDRLVQDVKHIVEAGMAVIDDVPYSHYTFLVNLLPSGGGGLEHLNSTSLHYRRWGFKPDDAYRGWLGLVAHEYFHLWNVKRIRPKALGPFDYTRENYTTLLWVAEGVTTYYSGQLTRRAGLSTPKQYLDAIGRQIADLQGKPGRQVQTVEEASFDAWIKYYRPNENTDNATISYYTKGAMIGLLLDLEIRHRTEGHQSLDDVMRRLYTEYHKKQQRGFTDAEFRATCEAVAGGSLSEIFDQYVKRTNEIDYDRYLNYAGLRIGGRKDLVDLDKGYLGIRTRTDVGRLIIAAVLSDGPAYEYGLNVNDEVIAIDGVRADDSFAERLAERKPGTTVTVTIARAGILREIDVILGLRPRQMYDLEKVEQPTPAQKAVYEGWMKAEWVVGENQ